MALYGSFLPVPKLEVFGGADSEAKSTAGQITFAEGEIDINEGRPAAIVSVQNTTDRPIQARYTAGAPYWWFCCF